MCAGMLTEPRLQTRDFAVVGVQRDLGAQVRAVDDADVRLRAADIAWILEGDPWVAVSNSIDSILRHRSSAAIFLQTRISPEAALAS